MVTYKGFNAYYCNPSTLEKLQYIRRFEYCICSCTAQIPTDFTYRSVSDGQAFLSNYGVDYRFISGLAMINFDRPDLQNALSTLQSVAPLTVPNLVNETGISCKILLEANDGFYATSQQNVSNGDSCAGSGSALNFNLYNPDGVYVGAWALTCYGESNMIFTAIVGYDGNFPSSGTIYPTVISATNTDLVWYDSRQRSFTSSAVANWFNSITPLPPEVTDPYAPGGNSDISEPNGDFDGTSEPIDFPSLPTLGAVDSGFITLFNPDLTELQALARYMWTNPLFDVSAWKKIFADPMDAILGLSIVPVAVPDGAARPIIVGNIATDVSMKVATAQFVEVQCGSLNVNEFWSAYLDYEPYTKAEIYLPFCGVHQLSVDDIMNKTVEVRYHVDILSGACCAFVKCGDSVLYQFIGQCSSSIPISGNDFTNVINGVLSATTAIGSLVATGGASAPLAVPSLSATALNAMKPNIEKSGAMGGTGGMLAIQKPYLVLTRPKQAHPENQNHYTGFPSFITESLSDLSGYTEIEKIHLEGVPATDDELGEIEALLKGGVIL